MASQQNRVWVQISCYILFILSWQQVEAALYNVHTAAPLSVKVIRDKFTNVSRGFCFVEYNTKEVGII